MRLKFPSLPASLKQGFRPLYLLFGAEILLIEETLDLLRREAKAAGFSERVRLTVEPGFDWNRLNQQGQSMSLFSEKRMMELRLPTGKPGDAGAKALIACADRLDPETILTIVCGPIEKRSQGAKWFKAVESGGIVVEHPAVNPGKLPDWISQRMRSKGLEFEPDAVTHLHRFVEGNLLAAAQEINLLSLLCPDKTITAESIRETIADHARFDIYGFVDACLGGSVNRVSRILQSLKHDQTEPVIILWALARDIRMLCQLSAAMGKGESPQSLFRRYGVWSSRSAPVTAALKRNSRAQWENLLRQIGQVDLMVKGTAPLQRKDVWEEIESISLGICGLRIQ